MIDFLAFRLTWNGRVQTRPRRLGGCPSVDQSGLGCTEARQGSLKGLTNEGQAAVTNYRVPSKLWNAG